MYENLIEYRLHIVSSVADFCVSAAVMSLVSGSLNAVLAPLDSQGGPTRGLQASIVSITIIYNIYSCVYIYIYICICISICKVLDEELCCSC